MGTNGQFGSIRKLPSGRYQVRYFHRGRHITADHTFPTKADARAFLAGVQTDLKRGHYVDPSAGGITFGEYAGWWIEQRPLRPRCGTPGAWMVDASLARHGPRRDAKRPAQLTQHRCGRPTRTSDAVRGQLGNGFG